MASLTPSATSNSTASLQAAASGITTASSANGPSSTASSDFSSSESTSTTSPDTSTRSSASPTSAASQPSSSADSSSPSSPSSLISSISSISSSPVPATISSSSTSSSSLSRTTHSPTPSSALSTSASDISSTSNLSTSTDILTVNGQLSTSSTTVPTALSTNTGPSTSHHSVIIASSVVGVIGFFVILVSLFFGYKRYQRRKVNEYIETITDEHRTTHARARLLDGEDLDVGDGWSRHYRDDSNPGSLRGTTPFHLPSRVHNTSTTSLNASIASRYTSNTQTSTTVPHLLRARGSETGSIFHEAVWPPPGEESRLVDPLVKASSQIDLSQIIDDIMGSSNEQIRQGGGHSDLPDPAPTVEPETRSLSGSQLTLVRDEDVFPPYHDTHNRTDSTMSSYTHSRDGSATSQTGLLPIPLAVKAQPKISSPLAKTAPLGSPTAGAAFGGGPSTVHWLKRSPRGQHPVLDKSESSDSVGGNGTL